MTLLTSELFDLSQFPHSGLFHAVSYPWEIVPTLESYLLGLQLGEHKGKISPQAYIIHPETIYIGEDTVIEPGAYVKGPCWIGNNCTIRHGAYIRGNFIAGDHCVIGHDTEIKNVVFLNHTHAAHFAYLGDSVIGNHVNLGAGTKCANVRLDKGIIKVQYEERFIETGLKKLGAIIGDYSQIGCNAVTNPGTILGKGVLCYPTLNIGGFIPSRSIIKPQSKLVISQY